MRWPPASLNHLSSSTALYLLPPFCLPPLCPLHSTLKTNCHSACKTHPESSLSHHFHQCLLSLSKQFSNENDFCLPKDIWWWLETFLLPLLWACYWHQCGEVNNAAKHPTVHRAVPQRSSPAQVSGALGTAWRVCSLIRPVGTGPLGLPGSRSPDLWRKGL